jgi:Flp pilus assembly pilin Flp
MLPSGDGVPTDSSTRCDESDNGRAARLEEVTCVRLLLRPLRRDSGQTAAEYSLVLGIITLAVMAALVLLSQTVRGLFESAVDVI